MFTSEIYFCIYDDKEGFLVDLCFQCPDALTYFYDCEGNIVCEFGGYLGIITCLDFTEKISRRVVVVETPPRPPVNQNNPKFQSKNIFGPQSKNLASIVRGYKIGVTKNARNIYADFAWQSC